MKKILFGILCLIMLFITSSCDQIIVERQDQEDIYLLAVEAGYSGTYEEWLETVKGDKGDQGISVLSIDKTSSDGLVDTYTIKYSDGKTSTFTITNGKDGNRWYYGKTIDSSLGNVNDYFLNTENFNIYKKTESSWEKICNIKENTDFGETYSINSYYMINDGLTELAANAVELVIDDKTGIAYACYLSSETSLGESSSLVKIAKFNILQPSNVMWVTVFDKTEDFGGHSLSECNIIDLDDSTIRVFVVDLVTQQYYYKDVDKKTLNVKEKNEVMVQENDETTPGSFNANNINTIISNMGGQQFNYLQFTSKIIYVDGYYYTTVCGGNAKQNFLFMKSVNGSIWTICSVVKHFVNYEAMLEYYDGKFWVMCRNGSTIPSDNKQQNLLYSEDGINWTQSNLELETSDTRPYLFQYQGELFLAYSSPLEENYSTIRNWRCNVHVGKIVSNNGVETFEEVIYKQSKFGIVYYALTDWYGKMIMLYSSGEIHPTEGLMSGWSQGKDCLNYTILHTEEPQLNFKKLSNIIIEKMPLRLKYSVGEIFDSSGLVVKAKYDDNSYKKINNYKISNPDMTTPGKKTITVTYTENNISKIAAFEIEVLEELKLYEEISSIKSTNEQYIKTNITTTKNTQIIIKMMKPTNDNVIDENGRWLFGSGARNFGMCLKPDGKYVLDIGGVRYQAGTINWQEGMNTLILGNGVYTLNGGPISNDISITSEVNPASDFRILGNPSSGFNTYLGATIYEIIIYNEDIKVMHLVPAKMIENNRIGFYDYVSNKMIFSSTTVDFYEGSINAENE